MPTRFIIDSDAPIIIPMISICVLTMFKLVTCNTKLCKNHRRLLGGGGKLPVTYYLLINSTHCLHALVKIEVYEVCLTIIIASSCNAKYKYNIALVKW